MLGLARSTAPFGFPKPKTTSTTTSPNRIIHNGIGQWNSSGSSVWPFSVRYSSLQLLLLTTTTSTTAVPTITTAAIAGTTAAIPAISAIPAILIGPTYCTIPVELIYIHSTAFCCYLTIVVVLSLSLLSFLF